MNYLAHAYLSFGHPAILTGNMISDFIKGRKQFDYPVPIQKGIRLHRQIDSFTDAHPVTKQASQFLKPAVGAYAGAFIDVVYDHFLANDETSFSEEGLRAFSTAAYGTLARNQEWLPEKFARMLPYMTSQDWLYNYRHTGGIEKSFGGIVRRAVYLDDASVAFALFHQHYDPLRDCYNAFFPDLKRFASAQLDLLLSQ